MFRATKMSEKNRHPMPAGDADLDLDWQAHPVCGISDAVAGLTLAVVPIRYFLARYLPGLPFGELRTARPLPIKASDFAAPLLAPSELERVNAFKSRKRQAEWMAGRLAAKTLAAAGDSEDPAPSDIAVAYHPEGAPYLVRRPDLSLSISHAHDYAVAGLATQPGRVLGLDLEKKRPLEIEYILRAAFSDRERRQPDAADQGRFFACWTLKEAYLKYLGRGFRESLKQVEILADGVIHHRGRPQVNLSTRVLQPVPDYTLAVVMGPAEK
jgi:4'-phosphopantetheinyl transferase